MQLLTAQNGKMKRARFRTLNFGIPALASKTGQVTCPAAKTCARGCYASQGTYRFSSTAAAYERRLAAIAAPDFVSRIAAEIYALRPYAFRWNDSGDFFNLDYLRKAYAVAWATPNVTHYAYTKQIKLVKDNPPPPNFTMIYSYGGKFDHLINPRTDRHCHIFDSSEALRAAGYIDAGFDDSLAWEHPSGKIGLVYHGASSKTWTTKPQQQPTGGNYGTNQTQPTTQPRSVLCGA